MTATKALIKLLALFSTLCIIYKEREVKEGKKEGGKKDVRSFGQATQKPAKREREEKN